ncbi:hypothetical protein E4U41_000704 [Claviceps citrina]|nr:hypothetical protein E4U41_000704 [Claviceps citrina]
MQLDTVAIEDVSNVDEHIRDISARTGLGKPKVRGPMNGGSNRIYQLEYPSGEVWSLRIPKFDDAASFSKSGMAILKHLKETRPSLRAPTPIYESPSHSLLTFLDGDVLDMAFRRSLPANSGWGDPLSFLYRRRSMRLIVPELNCPDMVVRHGDLNSYNILVNEDGLSGVVDWDTARYLPMPAAVHYPLFIADIPGWLNDIPDGKTFEEDRAYFEMTLRKLAAAGPYPNHLEITSLLQSSFERQFFELALRNKKINSCYIDMKINNQPLGKTALKEELEAFLCTDPMLREDPRVLELWSRLDSCDSPCLII